MLGNFVVAPLRSTLFLVSLFGESCLSPDTRSRFTLFQTGQKRFKGCPFRNPDMIQSSNDRIGSGIVLSETVLEQQIAADKTFLSQGLPLFR